MQLPHAPGMCLGLLLACVAAAATAQPPGPPRRLWIGPPTRVGPLTTNNGQPSMGINRYMEYSWPSLGEALARYGFCGKRIRSGAVPLTVRPQPPERELPPRPALAAPYSAPRGWPQ